MVFNGLQKELWLVSFCWDFTEFQGKGPNRFFLPLSFKRTFNRKLFCNPLNNIN